MNITLSFTLTPSERRQTLRAWSLLGVLRTSAVGVPVAAVGLGMVIWRIKPGTASGGAILLLIFGLGFLVFPQVALFINLMRWDRNAAAAPDRAEIHVTLTDTSLNYEHDEMVMDLPWRHVTSIRTTADCWLMTLRGAQTELVIPKRAIPTGLEAEVAEFLRNRAYQPRVA